MRRGILKAALVWAWFWLALGPLAAAPNCNMDVILAVDGSESLYDDYFVTRPRDAYSRELTDALMPLMAHPWVRVEVMPFADNLTRFNPRGMGHAEVFSAFEDAFDALNTSRTRLLPALAEIMAYLDRGPHGNQTLVAVISDGSFGDLSDLKPFQRSGIFSHLRSYAKQNTEFLGVNACKGSEVLKDSPNCDDNQPLEDLRHDRQFVLLQEPRGLAAWVYDKIEACARPRGAREMKPSAELIQNMGLRQKYQNLRPLNVEDVHRPSALLEDTFKKLRVPLVKLEWD